MITCFVDASGEVTFISIVWPVVCVGVPFNVPAAKLALPHVRALERIEVAPPPVMIGVTVVVVPASARHRTAVIVSVAP